MRTFRVLTINTWLLRLPFGLSLAPHVKRRAKRLPKTIKDTRADIVLCQEVWDPKLRAQLKRDFAINGFPYEVSSAPSNGGGALSALGLALPIAFASANPTGSESAILALSGGTVAALAGSSVVLNGMRRAMGNGLQIFSRFELSDSIDVMKFSSWTRQDEVFATKGGIRARARVPGFGWIDIYNSHLGAVTYHSRKAANDPGQSERRLEQAIELSDFIDRTQTSDFAILGVDLNAKPYETEHSLFASHRLMDTFDAVGPAGDPGYTDGNDNSYKQGGPFSHTPDGRIDYIFSSRSPKIRPIKSEVVFKDTPISDHYGVLTEFEIW